MRSTTAGTPRRAPSSSPSTTSRRWACCASLGIEFGFADRFSPNVYRRGRRHSFKRFVTDKTGADIGRFRVRLARLRPSPALDSRSAAWLIRDLGLSDRARFLIGHELREAYGVEPEYLSLLFYVQQSRVSRDAATVFRIRGGADRLPLALARGLDVHLEEPASHIERQASGVSVDGIDADFCVVTVPVPVLGVNGVRAQSYRPPSTAAVERLAYGHGVKTVLQYEREPTRGVVADLTFQTAWDLDRRLVTAYSTGRNGILLGSGEPPHAAALGGRRARRRLPGLARPLRARGVLRLAHGRVEPRDGGGGCCPRSGEPLSGGGAPPVGRASTSPASTRMRSPGRWKAPSVRGAGLQMPLHGNKPAREARLGLFSKY